MSKTRQPVLRQPLGEYKVIDGPLTRGIQKPVILLEEPPKMAVRRCAVTYCAEPRLGGDFVVQTTHTVYADWDHGGATVYELEEVFTRQLALQVVETSVRKTGCLPMTDPRVPWREILQQAVQDMHDSIISRSQLVV